MRKILDRYILREIALPFVMVLFILTFVLLMGRILQLMDLLVNKGVGFLDIMKFVLLLMPSFLMFTIPMSLLVSILIGLGRLSGDNEITVMKASGVSLYQIARPIAVAAVIAFLLTGIITLFLVPQSKYATKVHLYNVSKQKASIGIREKVFIDYFKGLLIYAESIPLDGAFMEGVLIADTRLTSEPSTIVAKRAYLVSDPRALTITMRLESGSTHTVDPQFRNYRKMDFEIYDVNLDIGSALLDEGSLKEKSTGEMNILELRKRLRQTDTEKRKLRDAAIELHKKLSIPVSCLILGFLAIPLGIRTNRAAKSWSISIGFGLTVLYYMLQLGGEALVQTDRVAPLIGTWVPNLVFGAAGILLFTMAARERTWRSMITAGAAVLRKREKGGHAVMTILDRYVTREFLKLFGLIVVSFIFLYLIFDFFEKINMFMSNRASLAQMASFFLFNIPMIVSLTLPAAVLLAALITFGVMSRNSEIVAMKANGISLYRSSLPLILLAGAICVIAFLFSEFVTPYTNQRAFQILKVEVQRRTELGTFKQNQIWYRSRQAIYNFKIFQPDRNLLQGITINYLDPQFQLILRIDAERAEWKDGQWLFQNILIARFNAGDFPVLERKTEAVIDLPEKPADFMIAQKDADKMGFLELRRYIEKLQSDGYDTTRYRADLHGKIAFPLVSIILAIIGVAFSLRSERSGGVTQSIGAGIVIGFSYWLVFAFAMSLGRAGTLPPLLAAWTANIAFGVASFLMYRRVKT